METRKTWWIRLTYGLAIAMVTACISLPMHQPKSALDVFYWLLGSGMVGAFFTGAMVAFDDIRRKERGE